ncbi:uncharacterized protein LOC117966929 [Acipenser ruthenus]|uniref:uncharacterized protein LOC117966929 n=1 Tax=Acipenser ruthenus TaxID=7906 RepID=UPI002741CF1A|nr:uncharacterized protein LOC117966929 [Acipenser ruthenus]
MDACTGLEGQPHPRLQYGTVPGRYYYHEPNYLTDLSDCRPEREPDRALGYWTIPGSRTGQVLQDYTNWRAAMAPSEPFNLDLQLGAHWELERREGREPIAREEWAEGQRARKARERRRGESWALRAESHSPSRLKRGLQPSWDQNFSYQGPRHWRYSHTLPRKTSLDPPSGTQLEREERWLCNPALQDPGLSRSRKELLGMLREEKGGTATQLTTRFPGTLSFEKARQQESREELKENQPEKRMFSQPPTYVPPPPYSAPHRTARVPNPRPEPSQLNISTAADRKAYSEWVLPCWNSPGEWRKEGREKGMEKKKKRLDPEIWPQTLGYGTWGGSTALSKQRPHLGREGPIDRELSGSPQKRFEGGELTAIPDSRRKKSRARETVFCLVSRPGSEAGGPGQPSEVMRSFPLPKSVTKAGQNSTERVRGRPASEGWEESSRNYRDRESSTRLPHKESHSQTMNREISGYSKPQAGRDRSQSAARHWSHSHWEEGERGSRRRESLQRAASEPREGYANYQTLPRVRGPRAKDRDRGRGNTSQNREALDTFEISSKTLALSGQRGLSGFPRWKETNQLGNPRIVHPKGETGSCGPTEDTGKLREERGEAQKDSSDNGVLVIDATCVIVTAEFIFPPKKEHVQYLYLASTDNSELPDMDLIPSNSNTDNIETGLQSLESLESKQQITETLSPCQRLLLNSRRSQHTPPASETLSGCYETQEAHNLETMDQVAIPSPVPANETLEERTRRILGILQEKSRLELEGALCRWEEEGETLGSVTEYDSPRSDNEEQEAQEQEEVEVWERDGERDASGGRDAGERNGEASPLGCCEPEKDEQKRGGGESVLPATGDVVETEEANPLGEELEVQPHRAEEISEPLHGVPAFQEFENWQERPGSPKGTEEHTVPDGETTDKPPSPAEIPTLPDALPQLDDIHFETEPVESSPDNTDGIQHASIEASPQQEITEGEIPSPEYCQYPPPPPPPPLPKDVASNSWTLWDAVNRIRKHTAPDSESEDEEVVEVWDRDGEADTSVGREAGEKSGEVVHLGGREPGEDEWGRLEGGEEDAFSCSSSDSHTSRDTVIIRGTTMSEEEEQGESDTGSDAGELGLGESEGFEIDGDDDSDAELRPIKEEMEGELGGNGWLGNDVQELEGSGVFRSDFWSDGELGSTEEALGGGMQFRNGELGQTEGGLGGNGWLGNDVEEQGDIQWGQGASDARSDGELEPTEKALEGGSELVIDCGSPGELGATEGCLGGNGWLEGHGKELVSIQCGLGGSDTGSDDGEVGGIAGSDTGNDRELGRSGSDEGEVGWTGRGEVEEPIQERLGGSGDGELGPTEQVHGGSGGFQRDTGSEWKLVTIEEEQEGDEEQEVNPCIEEILRELRETERELFGTE